MSKLLQTIEDFLDDHFFSIFDEIRRLYEKITGCIAYFVFIWKHDAYREWDYEYLYDIILFKLDRMAKQLEKDNYVADGDVNVNRIREAIDLFERYRSIEDEYNELVPDSDIENRRNYYLKIAEMKQNLWERFNNLLRDEAQGWWS